MPDHKTSYPPEGKFLYYSGNEIVPAYGQHLPPGQKPAPRGHRVVAQGQSGATFFAALQKATLQVGAQTLLQASVRRLVCEQNADGSPGRVLGVVFLEDILEELVGEVNDSMQREEYQRRERD
mgnify:CR=1 FL=1